jgi:hypothetical protein
MVLTFATVALEHLAKAYLCSPNPALIADLRGKDFDSLLHLVGEGGRAQSPHLRTVGATDAIDRSSRLIPRLRPLAPQLRVGCSRG